MMRSLAVKFTLAFLLVGLTGAVLVAVLVGVRTRTAFDQFVTEQSESTLADFLETFYAQRQSWDELERFIENRRFDVPRDVTVVDLNGRIQFSNPPVRGNNQTVNLDRIRNDKKTALRVNGETVGWLILPERGRSNAPTFFNNRISPETIGREFLSNVAWAATVSAIIAVLISLLMGVLLARTLTKPIRELTAVTQRMAKAELGLQVPVQSQDEIGQLTASFNQMSHDLAQNQQQRRQMTADIAHDLRTPLTVLRGYMEGLQNGRLQGSEKLYDIMFGEVLHLQHLVEELRTLSLADAGELSLNLRSVEPKALLERSGLAHMVQAEEKGIAIRIDAPDGLPSIQVDTDRMTQVLNNLVANALAHTERGEIVLSAAQAGDSVTLSVRDTGAGIAAADLPHVFNRFYRADKARQDSASSSGLGLAIAKAIVEAHGGGITAVSTKGSGTTFLLRLQL